MKNLIITSQTRDEIVAFLGSLTAPEQVKFAFKGIIATLNDLKDETKVEEKTDDNNQEPQV